MHAGTALVPVPVYFPPQHVVAGDNLHVHVYVPGVYRFRTEAGAATVIPRHPKKVSMATVKIIV